MTTYNYRCSHRHCRARKTLKKRLRFYLRRPKCPECGRDSLKHDPAVARQTQKRTCYCVGIRYPHRRGTFLNEWAFCVYAPVDLEFEGARVYEMKPEDPCPF